MGITGRTVLRALRLEWELGLRKLVLFHNVQYASLALPRFPSAAYDAAVARGALNRLALGTPANRHIDNVILGISRRCTYHCEHCYEEMNIGTTETIPVERWQEVIAELQQFGVGIMILSGGEPLLRWNDVLTLLRTADHDRTEFHLHTSGWGMTAEAARELRRAGLSAAAVGLDDAEEERHDRMRGAAGAFRQAHAALQHLHAAGIFTYVNVCLSAGLVRSGALWRFLELARDLRVGIIQLLEPRPCGGYAGSDVGELFTAEDQKVVKSLVHAANTRRRFRSLPLVYNMSDLEASPLVGCTMGGLTHFTIDSTGEVRPCVFVPVSFGNIRGESLAEILPRMRAAVPAPIHKGCGSLLVAQVVREAAERGFQPPIPFEAVRQEWAKALYG
jgi:MoaA/NifB/PqqE/SkfB family radical SAM enzyme